MSVLDLKKVTVLSSLLFTEAEITLLLKDDELISGIKEACEKGRLSGVYEIRKAMFNEAKKGSVQAQMSWLQMKIFIETHEKRNSK